MTYLYRLFRNTWLFKRLDVHLFSNYSYNDLGPAQEPRQRWGYSFIHIGRGLLLGLRELRICYYQNVPSNPLSWRIFVANYSFLTTFVLISVIPTDAFGWLKSISGSCWENLGPKVPRTWMASTPILNKLCIPLPRTWFAITVSESLVRFEGDINGNHGRSTWHLQGQQKEITADMIKQEDTEWY